MPSVQRHGLVPTTGAAAAAAARRRSRSAAFVGAFSDAFISAFFVGFGRSWNSGQWFTPKSHFGLRSPDSTSTHTRAQVRRLHNGAGGSWLR